MLAARSLEVQFLPCLPRQPRDPVAVQGQSRQRADHIGPAVVQAVLGMRMRHKVFVGEFPVITDRDAVPDVAVENLNVIPEEEGLILRDDRRAADRLLDEIGNRNGAQHFERALAIRKTCLDLILEANKFIGRRDPAESADDVVDRMNRPSADDFLNRVPQLFQAQGHLDGIRNHARQADDAGVPHQVGQVQNEDVQRMAFDVGALEREIAQLAGLRRYLDSQRIFQACSEVTRMVRGADGADAGDDLRYILDGFCRGRGLRTAGCLRKCRNQLC